MTTSFVEYRGRGFWSSEAYLERLLSLLADRIGSSPSEDWLSKLRDHWRAQSSGNFRAWIHPNLDEFFISDQRRELVFVLTESISSDPGMTREVRETARLLEILLRGQMDTDASSPLDYMVT